VLAELVRTDRDHHRPIAGDSEQAAHLKVLARSHQSLIWSRQRQANLLRSTLREFYPAALQAFSTDLFGRDALAVLAIAMTPAAGKALSEQQVQRRCACGRLGFGTILGCRDIARISVICSMWSRWPDIC
jgi:hypothetical protein